MVLETGPLQEPEEVLDHGREDHTRDWREEDGHLIDAIADHMLDGVNYTSADEGMDRLNALVWIARDQIDVLNENIAKHYREIRGWKPRATS